MHWHRQIFITSKSMFVEPDEHSVSTEICTLCVFQTFQLRAHIYQARSLIASDASGLSDPYATVSITEFSKTTQVIEETLSPTWDELLVFDEILVYSSKEEIRKNPPTIVIEIYDQDKVGKSEFIGRAIAKPNIKLKENPYITPSLEWFDITRGVDGAGELLAAFEMLELGSEDLPRLTEPKVMPVEIKPGEFSFFSSIIHLNLSTTPSSRTICTATFQMFHSARSTRCSTEFIQISHRSVILGSQRPETNPFYVRRQASH